MPKQFALAAVILLFSIHSTLAWISYEHTEIGDKSYEAALVLLDKQIKNSRKKLSRLPHISPNIEAIGVVADMTVIGRFSFGQLSAIYGDYASGVDAVNSADFKTRIEGLKRITRGTSSLFIPAEHGRMKNLAANNPTHFSLRAAQEYVKWHKHALELVEQDNSQLWKALHYEAMAQHSLTDLFAFGHMIQDRELTERIFNWATRRTRNQVISTRDWTSFANMIGKATGAHTNFYHNAYNWAGAMMKNSFGDEWRGFGDGKYRIAGVDCKEKTHLLRRKCSDPVTSRQRQVVVRASAVSVGQVLQTALGIAVTPGYEYLATCYVPIHYWNTYEPLEPRNQISSIYKLHSAMNNRGTPMAENGFDFSLGFLEFKSRELRGTVDYADYIGEICNLN